MSRNFLNVLYLTEPIHAGCISGFLFWNPEKHTGLLTWGLQKPQRGFHNQLINQGQRIGLIGGLSAIQSSSCLPRIEEYLMELGVWKQVQNTSYTNQKSNCTFTRRLLKSDFSQAPPTSMRAQTNNTYTYNHTATLIESTHIICTKHCILLQLVAWRSSRTSIFDRRTFPILRLTYRWWVTTYVDKPSAAGQQTRPTQPFILSGLIDE